MFPSDRSSEATSDRDQDRDQDRLRPRAVVLPHVHYHPSSTPPQSRPQDHCGTQEGPDQLHRDRTSEVTSDRDQDRLRPSAMVLPHVRYHPSITPPQSRPQDHCGTQEGPDQLHRDRTSEVTSDRDQDRLRPRAMVLPHVRYHPSITPPQSRPQDHCGTQEGPDQLHRGRLTSRDSPKPEQGCPGTRSRKTSTPGNPGNPKGNRSRGDASSEREVETEVPGQVQGQVQDLAALSLDLSRPRPGSVLPQTAVNAAEVRTRGQRNNPEWFVLRKNRITASVAHAVANSRFSNGTSSTPPSSYVKAILGQGVRVQTRAMSWGVEHEAEAVRRYQEQQSAARGRDVLVQDCGLFIDPLRPWLAASPDGIVTDAETGKKLRILEVKCPFKHRQSSVRQAARDDPHFCLRISPHQGTQQILLKESHPYFTQVQIQMAVTGLTEADFVVFTEKDLAVIPVQFDPVFWNKMVKKLEYFYIRAVVPSLSPAWRPET